MKIARFQWGDDALVGSIDGNRVFPILGNPFAGEKCRIDRTTWIDLANLRYLAPTQPSKVVAVGENYRRVGAAPEPDSQIYSVKVSTAVLPDGGDIVYPQGLTEVIAECELGVVISAKATKVSADRARDYIL